MNRRQKKKMKQKYNKQLIERYPFLLPRNRWTDEVLKNYNYSYTELDAMPKGWRKSFGLLLCEEIKDILIKDNLLENYRIMQIKEKFGGLRWYDCGAPIEVHDIIHKYEYLSEHICIDCGKFDVSLFDDGWVSPYCDKCFIKHRKTYYKNIQKFSKTELAPFDEKEVLEKYKLEDDEIKMVLRIESLGKNGSSWREIDLTETINKIKEKKQCF